jgi:hypothetical protein
MPVIRNKSHNEMMNILSQFAMSNLGFGPVGEIRMLAKSGENAYNFYRDKINDANLHLAVWKAEEAMVTKRNDVMLVTPDSHAWLGDVGATTTTLTWDKESTHMLGMAPPNLAGYGRARFSHAGNSLAAVSMITVSGSSNTFKNVRFMHGIGEHDHTCLTLSGSGNTFENVAFATPTAALQAGSVNYLGIVLSGTQNHFKNCTFGTANDIDRSAANAILSIGAACGGWNIFENCVFRSRSGGGQATAYFINCVDAGTVVDTPAIFLNCQFIHTGTQLTVAIAKTTNTSRPLYFDNRCSFSNVADVIAEANETEIWWGGSGANADETSIGDRVCLGLAKNPNHTT